MSREVIEVGTHVAGGEQWQAKLARCFSQSSVAHETVLGFRPTDFLGLDTKRVCGALQIDCRNYLTGKVVTIVRMHPLAGRIETLMVRDVVAEIARLRRIARLKKPAASTLVRISCAASG
jgi:hypothetical protein